MQGVNSFNSQTLWGCNIPGCVHSDRNGCQLAFPNVRLMNAQALCAKSNA